MRLRPTRSLVPILALALGASATAQDGAGALSKMPPLDRQWTAIDIRLAAAEVGSRPPKIGVASVAPFFDRVLDRRVLDVCIDQTRLAEIRLQECLAVGEGYFALLAKYLGGLSSDPGYEATFGALAGQTLRWAAAMQSPIESFRRSLNPDQPGYDVRMEGHARARRGQSQMLQGAVTMLTERQTYSNATRTELATILAEVFPTLEHSLEGPVKSQVKATLRNLAKNDPHPEVRAALVSIALRAQ